MSKMISVASGFQYSVNIGYDLNDESKCRSFIPTRSALMLLEDILLSTVPSSSERSRILIGAYGKGKSHIVLMILSILMKKDIRLFEKMLPRIKENKKLEQLISNYYDSDNKILPVVISGSNTSLPQAFLLALQRTLSENSLLDAMPESNYKAAVDTINRWKKEFPNTYTELRNSINVSIETFIDGLKDYNVEFYETFEKVYPSLTSGSKFNPFLGFDVIELYEEAIRGLRSKGYSGIFVVYDEFSKFLEANISEASVSDTKMLQDFAEKCNRSGKMQMHLMLISHKEIANYIDKLPKQKVDGWRGVSERFLHVHLNNNFTQTYEIISTVIQKNKNLWTKFCNEHKVDFYNLKNTYFNHKIFDDCDKNDIEKYIYSCYPLHPVSTFILPRLSERVAQNERTLFTFLSAKGISTLSAFLDGYDDKAFSVITPDLIYDYFEPLFRKEAYLSNLHTIYILTENILSNLDRSSLEGKLIKTISLIYILEQFEKLKPTSDELIQAFSIMYSGEEIRLAISNLIEKEYVIYLKKSNNYLQLKKSSGVNIQEKINDMIEKQKNRVSVKSVINASNFDKYMYPSRYNSEKEMTRFFSFEFISENEVYDNVNWNNKSSEIEADGVIYAVIPEDKEGLIKLKKLLLKTSEDCNRCIFIIPRKFIHIENTIKEFSAVLQLRDEAVGDDVLFDEYQAVYEDLRDVINSYISFYTHPEKESSNYIFCGEEKNISRKSEMTELMSDICNDIFTMTPVINNEVINQNYPTATAVNSRNKVVAGLLRNQLEDNLGLTGTGQDVSIMRSTLLRTGVLINENGIAQISLNPANDMMRNLLNTISDFIRESRHVESVSFKTLYDYLTLPEYNIGLRKGVIPIYLAAVLHEYRQNIIVKDKNGQLQLSSDLLLQINSNPSKFELQYIAWDNDKEAFIDNLEVIFGEYIVDAEKRLNSYDYAVAAMKRWYMSLSKYAKETKTFPNGKKLDKRYLNFVSSLKRETGTYDFLFKELPSDFGYSQGFSLVIVKDINTGKAFYDGLLYELKKYLIDTVKNLFGVSRNNENFYAMSLTSVIKDFCDSLDKSIFEELFSDGTDKCLNLFKNITNDEETFILKLAKLATGLRIEDWNNDTIKHFEETIKQYKATIQSYIPKEKNEEKHIETDSYEMAYINDNGVTITKRFNKIETSKRGKLLYNSIVSQMESMGHSVSEQEKRQILMDILKELC